MAKNPELFMNLNNRIKDSAHLLMLVCWQNFPEFQQVHGGNPVQILLLDKDIFFSRILAALSLGIIHDTNNITLKYERVDEYIESVEYCEKFFKDYQWQKDFDPMLKGNLEQKLADLKGALKSLSTALYAVRFS